MAGKAMPMIEMQKAPTREMNRSMYGMATAKPTEKKNVGIKSQKFFLNFLVIYEMVVSRSKKK